MTFDEWFSNWTKDTPSWRTSSTVREGFRIAWDAAVAAERERLRGYFMEALADKVTTWPGEVDILYDRCFAAPYVPDEDA